MTRDEARGEGDGRRGELEYVLPWLVRRPGNRVQPLRDGREAFPAMLEAIRGATRSVHLQTYTLGDDAVGRAFLAALLERRAAGLDVRLLYDAVGSLTLSDAFAEPLRAAGASVVMFNSVTPWRKRFAFNRRDHQKSLIVDDRTGFVGGLNITVEYAPLEEQGGGWRDQSVRIDGPAVRDLALNFRRTWMLGGGASYPEPSVRAARSAGTSEVAVVSNFRANRGGLSGRAMSRSVLHAIRKARRQVSIMSAYFIPGVALRRALRNAVARGADVRVIVPAVSDVPAARWAGCHLYGRLLRGGVRILEWPATMMHAKMAVIDGVWSTVGTYNIDHRSLVHNLEVGVIVLDRAVGAALQQSFDEDAARCSAVELHAWRRRPWTQRALETTCHGLRYWL